MGLFRISVSNIAPVVTQDQIRELFTCCGPILECKQTFKQDSNSCLLTFSDPQHAKAASLLDGTPLGDKTLVVREVNPMNDSDIFINQSQRAKQPLKQFSTTVSQQSNNDPAAEQRRIDDLILISRTIYIGNLAPEVYETEIRQFFEKVGPVVYIKMAGNPLQGVKYAFLEFEKTESAKSAMALSGNDLLLAGRPVKVGPAMNPIVKTIPPSVVQRPNPLKIQKAMQKVREAQERLERLKGRPTDEQNNDNIRKEDEDDEHRRSRRRSRSKSKSKSRSRSRKRSSHRRRHRHRSRSKSRSRSRHRRSSRRKRSRSRDSHRSSRRNRHSSRRSSRSSSKDRYTSRRDRDGRDGGGSDSNSHTYSSKRGSPVLYRSSTNSSGDTASSRYVPPNRQHDGLVQDGFQQNKPSDAAMKQAQKAQNLAAAAEASQKSGTLVNTQSAVGLTPQAAIAMMQSANAQAAQLNNMLSADHTKNQSSENNTEQTNQ